jgi:pimeloyl-ACP methyl ester carboxylesterase
MPIKKTIKVIILAHGITVDKDEDGVFIKLANTLQQNGYAVFRFDFRGHGESSGRSTDMTISGEAMDLEAVINEIKNKGYKKIGLLGASFAGGPCAIFASKNLANIKCFCLWNPVLNYEHTFFKPFLPWLRKRTAQMNKDIGGKGWTTLGSRNFVVGKALFDEMKNLKPYQNLKKITIPTLIIHGDKDSKVPYEDSKEYVKYLSKGRFVTIAGAGHGFHEDSETPLAIKETVSFFKINL